jgi:hypothetical protein
MSRTIIKIVSISGICFALGVLLAKILFAAILPIQGWYFDRYVKPHDPGALPFMWDLVVVPVISLSLTAILAGYLLKSKWWLYPLIAAAIVAVLQAVSAYEYSFLPRYRWDWELIAFYLIFVPISAWAGHFLRSHWKGKHKGRSIEHAL